MNPQKVTSVTKTEAAFAYSSSDDDDDDSSSSTSSPIILPRRRPLSVSAQADVAALRRTLEILQLERREQARRKEQLEREEEARRKEQLEREEEARRRQEQRQKERNEFLANKKRFDALLQRGEFASIEDDIDRMSNHIKCGRYYAAVLGDVAMPGDFFVSPAITYSALENMMDILQDDYKFMHQINARSKTTIGIPWRGHLIGGFLVGVKFQGLFHRARIIGDFPRDHYMMQLIDYGDTIVTSYDDIRYLPKRFLKFKIQAIQCKVLFNNLKVDKPWTKEDGDVLKGIMNSVDSFIVHFKNKYVSCGETAWEVFIHAYDSRRGKISKFHLEREMLLQTGRTLGRDDKEITDTKEKVFLANFNFAQFGCAK